MDLAAVLLAALAASTSSAPAQPAKPSCAPAACTSPAPHAARRITMDTVVASLNTLLRDEGLPQIRRGTPVLRYIDLDGDARTEEALVDVVAPELCDLAGQCTTLVVRALPCGRLAAVGHGRWLAPLQSRTAGYMDLGETQRSLPLFFPVVVRALHWTGIRYSR